MGPVLTASSQTTTDLTFEQLWEDHSRGLFAFLVYRTGDRELAEDVVAETFEKALRRRSSYDPARGSGHTWIYAIALNCLKDRGRRGLAEKRALDRLATSQGGEEAPDELQLIEERDLVMRGLSKLTRRERDAVALRYGGGLNIAEIAAATGARKGAINARLHRALEKLRGEFDF
jgi:RNA polymerase sigma-70 factor (ECF subfamily)